MIILHFEVTFTQIICDCNGVAQNLSEWGHSQTGKKLQWG